MQAKLYYSNILIGINVFFVAWIATSASMLESFSIALYAFIVANFLDHFYEYFSWNKKRGLSLQFTKNGNVTPSRWTTNDNDNAIKMDSLDGMDLVSTEDSTSTSSRDEDEETKKNN
jgi:hypothetical protein